MKWDLSKLSEKWKGAGKYQYALLVLALGALLMLLPTGRERGDPPAGDRTSQTEPFELERFEKRLEDTLSHVEGAGEVQVMLTMDSGSRQILAQDQERDREGATSSTVVTMSQGGGKQDVAVLQTMAPKFRGALVVCSGGKDPTVRLGITQALSALTGLRADQIAVCVGTK